MRQLLSPMFRGLLPSSAFAALLVSTSAYAQPAPTQAPTTTDAAPAPAAPETPIETEAVDVFLRSLSGSAGGLTSARVTERALKNSHVLEGKTAELSASQAVIIQATAQLIPRLSLSASYTRLSETDTSLGGGSILGALNPGLVTVGACPDGAGQCVLDSGGLPIGAAEFSIESPLNVFQLRAGLNIPLSDYFFSAWAAPEAAKLSERSASYALEAEKPNIAADAKLAYLDWVRALGQVAVAENSLANLRDRKPEVDARVEVGTATKADKLRMEALIAGSEVTLSRAEALRELAEARLAILMNEPPKRYVLGDDVMTIPAAGLETQAASALASEAIANRKDLAAISAQADLAELDSDIQTAGAFPKLSLNGELLYANPNPRSFGGGAEWAGSWSVGALLSWTPNDTIASTASISQADARAASLRASRASLEDAVTLQATSARLEIIQATKALEGTAREYESGVEAHRVAVELYREGIGTTSDVVDAEAQLVRVQLNRLEAIIGLHTARANLDRTIGRAQPEGGTP